MVNNKIIFLFLVFFIFLIGYSHFFWKTYYFQSCSSFLEISQKNDFENKNGNLFANIESIGVLYNFDESSCEGKIGLIFYVENIGQLQKLKAILKKNEVIPYKVQNI